MKKINYNKHSDLLKALGHPIRLKMVVGLMEGDGCNVNKIVSNLNIPQSTASQHLKVLKMNGVIDFKKEGVRTCYRVVNKTALEIINALKK